MSCAINIADEMMTIPFTSFGLQEYELFLKCKKLPEYQLDFDPERETYLVTAPSRFARVLGMEAPRIERAWLPMSEFLYDYQKYSVQIALDAKRFAIWEDCGLGKTLEFLEFLRQVLYRHGGRALIFSPLNVVDQTINAAREFYGDEYPIRKLETREALIEFCKTGTGVGITNYEKMVPRSRKESGVINELRLCTAVVLDESSILKSGGGVIKWNLIKSCKGVEYKLSCTATPAPNDVMEYASQAAFLEKLRNEGEILWTYFKKDKAGNWKIKPHALRDFYRFMASWSIYMRSPAVYGFKDNVAPLPEMELVETAIEATEVQRKFAYDACVMETGDFLASEKMGIETRGKLNEAAKGFHYVNGKPVRIPSRKPAAVAKRALDDMASGLQVIIWTVFDEEAAIIEREIARLHAERWEESDLRRNIPLPGLVRRLDGKTPKKARPAMIEAYQRGEFAILISKASMLGYGMNLQCCGSMIFSGWNDSFEQFYQAVKRAYRYGQKRRLKVWLPCVYELEGKILENVREKWARFERETQIMEKIYIHNMKELLAA